MSGWSDEHSNSSYTNNALNQLGLIHYNAGEYDDALTYYERVATNYPGTAEADNALTSIKNIYVRKDNVDGYLDLCEQLGPRYYPERTGFSVLYGC